MDFDVKNVILFISSGVQNGLAGVFLCDILVKQKSEVMSMIQNILNKMNKKWLLLLIPVILILAFCIIFLIQRSHAQLYETDTGTAISVIGGADGPTSIFIAGKTGEKDINTEKKTEQESGKMKIEIQIGSTVKTAELESNASVDELVAILNAGELKMSASNYGGFEKVCTIGQSISRDDKQITTKPGDIMLYNGSQLVIFYDSNSWAYTPIGHINESAAELEKFLSGNENEVIIRLLQ